ncbi:WxL domain-containing protein [Lolliginicoccus levis]|uniref:WxL domain-containing protein n=1 Tax=Lolliginicoccus levis TaxID=2919542 RepID=UPI00241FB9CB|nr:WxL domain-containing protein [Lolliginicoccus levis]
MRTSLKAGIATIGALTVIVPGSLAHAQLDTGTTLVTATLLAGPLTIVPPAAAVISPALDQLSASGQVLAVTVSDLRLSNAGWTTTAVITDFTDLSSNVIPAANTTYTPASAVTTGSVTVTPSGAVVIDSAQNVQTATASGANTAIWDATLDLDTTGAVAGVYTATLTHSVF